MHGDTLMPKDILIAFDGVIARLRSEGESALFSGIFNKR
jgi:hypothetical protein